MTPAFDLHERGAEVRIRLQRPPVNVLDLDTIRALDAALEPLAARRDLKVVVLASGLPGVFSAGVDVAAHARDRAPAMLSAFHALLRRIDGLPQVALAAVDGACLGGACELAASCDFVLATPRARFGLPEIDVGCFPPGAAALLPRLLGRAAATLILTGEPVGADEAARIGLVSRVVQDLQAETDALAARLSGKSGAVLAIARRAVRDGGRGSYAEALERAERLYLEKLLPTHDVEEGVRAFLEKRPPAWRDE